jgi:Flp pilus assembly protein TadG
MQRPLQRLARRVHRLLCRWQADRRGVAAIEFALLDPLMAVMFIGAMEMSQAITVDRRVTQIAGSTADLIAGADTTTAQRDLVTGQRHVDETVVDVRIQRHRRHTDVRNAPTPVSRCLPTW